uniref:Protein-tyrosine-phosphatase n=1 Tax=Panagrolaimus sp. JU765 TaxID=591449 RepID=A0AC34Q1Y1_9BILA
MASLNGTELLLKCPPAEELVRTHMAPDFEYPQLVRRLDWFHDELLVASYQQDNVGDINRQWWVANKRIELIKPFYMLRIAPVLPEDSGTFKCRLETDPLFALDISTFTTHVIVTVKPLAPSKPQVTSYTQNSITLSWTESAAAAHKPILRYSILVSQLDDENIRVISTKDNTTSAVITNLKPYTKYSFAIRAENAAGHSNFGPEIIFRTLGEAPTTAPIIVSLTNGSDGCIDVEWKSPPISNGQIVGYRIMVHKIADGSMREWYIKGNKQSLCNQAYFSEHLLSIEADNGFGYSPPATTRFITDQSVPEGPPEMIQMRPIRSDAVMISWHEPSIPNGLITTYLIHYKETKEHRTYKTIRLLVKSEEPSKSFSYNVTKLKPYTNYKFLISAATIKGEGPKSSPMTVLTDHGVPAAPQIMNITYECHKDVSVNWIPMSFPISFYRVFIESVGKPATYNTTEQRLDMGGLLPNVKYVIQVSAVLRSIFDNNTFFESNYSKPEVFQVKDKCNFQSSICSSFNHNCVPITTRPGNSEGNSLSFTIILLGVFFIVSIGLFFVWILKRQCIFVKQYLKKTDRKHPQETISLVYDANEVILGETITIGRFEKYYEEMAANDNEGFRQQFEEIELATNGVLDETDDQFEENKLKNRYLNIGAVESTRIRLHSGSTSDYINANYIDSCDAKNVYIATQAPLPHTFIDFWAMVVQEKSNVIVVITNMIERGRRKCDQYWPATCQSTSQFGQFSVTLVSEMCNANFVHRILHLKSTANCMFSERTIHQVHFTSWPDHGVPETVFPLLSFMNYVAEIQSTGPIIVHCSAGIGRSGSFILIDSMRRHLLQCDRINIEAHLKHIRKQRTRLVQTSDQYIFCHKIIRELIKHGISRQPVLNFAYYVNFLYSQRLSDGRTRLQAQYDDLCKCPHSPPCEHETGYVALPGYHRSNEFLVGNWKNACDEMWAALWEHNCQTVLVIGTETDVKSYFSQYFADNQQRTGIRVERREEDKFWLHNNEDELCVKLIQADPAAFEIDFWGEMERIQDNIFQYHNCQMMIINNLSCPNAAMICCLQSVACQMEQERFVDVLPFISTYRYLFCNCWKSQSNLEYVYDKLAQLSILQHQHR